MILQLPPIAPVSLSGWVTLVIACGTFGMVLFDRVTGRGRSLAKIDAKLDRLAEEMDDFRILQRVMDTHLGVLSDSVKMLTFELRGVDGQNGIKGQVQANTEDIEVIQKRNAEIDAVSRHDREFREDERRELRRKRESNEERG